MIRAIRDAFLHPGDAADLGVITVVPRDPQVTNIGPAGGVATDSQGLVEVQIPPGATSEDVPVRITPLTQREHLPFPLPSTTVTTYAFELEPHGKVFDIPVTVRMANFRNLPPAIQIPVGYVDETTAKWVHEGWAVWDGTRFKFETTHFSTHDANSPDPRVKVYTLSQGSNPNNSETKCGIGSSVGVANGSLGQTLPLPSYRRQGRSYGVTLNYNSGLAGSRVYGQRTGDGVTTKASVGHGTAMQAPTAMVLTAECVSASSAGGCGSGGCGGIAISTEQVSWTMKWRGAGSESTTSGTAPGSAKEIELPGGFVIPKSDPSHIAGSGFLQTHIQLSLPGRYRTAAGTCVGGGGTFGVQQSNMPTYSVPGLESGPAVEMSRHVFIHHRYSSPFGAGWGISEIDRAYVDPAADQVIVVRGDGREESFVPRHVPRVVHRQPAREPTQVPLRDPVTGELFIVTGSGTITRIEPNGSPTNLLSGLALGTRLWGGTVAYVDGERRFVTAGTTQVTEVRPDGQTNVLATRTPPNPNSQFTRANIAARGDLVFYTSGLVGEPVVQMIRLSDPGRAFTPVTMASGGDVKMDPTETLSAVSLAGPRGLAFGEDGALYVADAPRHLVFRARPQPNGEVGPDSRVERVVGNGASETLIPLGEHAVGIRFPVAEPVVLSMASGGTLWIGTSYGLATYSTQSTEAKWLLFDQNVRASEFPMMLLDQNNAGGGANIMGIDGDTFWANDVVDTMYGFDVVLRSEFEPTRTLTRDALGITLTDTTADTIDLFDTHGRFIERRRRTGEPILAASYVDATSSRIDRLSDPTGSATQFSYDARGKLASITDPTGRTTTFVIDSAGDMKSLTLPDDEVYEFAYDAHRMKTKTSPRREVTNYTYDPAGLLSTSTKPTGEKVTVTASMGMPQQHDPNGGLVRAGGSMTDAHNVTHHYTMNAAGGIMKEQYTADGTSYTLETVYAQFLAPQEAQQPSLVFFEVPNRIYRVQTRKLNGVQIEPYRIYDDFGRVVREERAPNNTGFMADYRYGSDGRLATVSFGQSNTTQVIDRDTVGRVSRIWDKGFFGNPTGRQTTFTWRPDGQAATITNHGVTTTFTYDDAAGTGLLTGATDTTGQQLTYGHDPAGNVNFYGDGAASGRYTFDAANRMTISEDGNGAQTLFSYNMSDCGCQQGDQLASIHTPDLPPGKSWTFTYASDGRVQTLTDPDGFPEAYDYETTGELKQLIDRNGRTSTWTHDQLGRELTFKDTLGRMHRRGYPIPVAPQWSGPNVMSGSASSTAATTDIAATLGNGDYQVGLTLYRDVGFPAQVEFYRDATFELSNGMEFDNVMRMTLRKDRGNLPVSSTQVFDSTFKGFLERNTYNVDTAAPLLKFRSGDEGGSERIHNVEFDTMVATGFGLPGQGDAASYTFGRDPAGKLTSVQRSYLFGETGPTSTITYKPNQRQVDRVVDDDGTHDFLYDLRGLVQTQTVAGEGTYTYGYDAVGRNTSLTFPDGHTRIQIWDAEGRLTSRCYEYSPPSQTRCYTATYDPAGNPLTLTDPEGTDTVEYDPLYRVKKVTRTTPGNPAVVENYDYNALGALKLNAGTVLDDQRPKKVGTGTADAGVPATYGGQPVTLDANGRITSFQGKTLTWTTRGMPLTATVGTETEKYRQDAFERLVVRDQTSPPADYYIYDDVGGMNVVAMRRWAGAFNGGRRRLEKLDNFLYDGVDHPIRLQHRDAPDAPTFQTLYYELDLVGNVRRLRGSAGEDLGGYRYTAFGKAYPSDATTPAAQVDQPLRWKGRWFNARTGLYDVRARMWSPDLGAFVSGDEFALLRKDSTLWGWPGQNPLRYSDPTGRDAEEWFLRNGNYLAAGVAAVAVAPLAIVGGAEIMAAVTAIETASASAATASIVQSSSTAIAEAIVAGGVATAPLVNDPRLQNIVSMLYRATDRFPGGTAGILRLEKLLRRSFSGSGHAQKAMEQLRRLERLLAAGDLSPNDRAAAEALVKDLRDAVCR